MTRATLPLLAALALVAGCGGGGGAPADPVASGPPTAAAAERAMTTRMEAEELSIRYLACVDEGVRRDQEVVFRCNVNFGEPHIVGYCAVLREGRAVTQVEDPALRCRRTRTGDEP